MNIDYEILLLRDVGTFYHLQRYLAWEAHAEKEYSRFMAAKK